MNEAERIEAARGAAHKLIDEYRPTFDQPVSWAVSKAAVPDILNGLGEILPDVQEALRKGMGSRFDSFTVYLMPDEAEAIWERFAEIRKAEGDAASNEKGTA